MTHHQLHLIERRLPLNDSSKSTVAAGTLSAGPVSNEGAELIATAAARRPGVIRRPRELIK